MFYGCGKGENYPEQKREAECPPRTSLGSNPALSFMLPGFFNITNAKTRTTPKPVHPKIPKLKTGSCDHSRYMLHTPSETYLFEARP